jgi:hypothetical protein
MGEGADLLKPVARQCTKPGGSHPQGMQGEFPPRLLQDIDKGQTLGGKPTRKHPPAHTKCLGDHGYARFAVGQAWGDDVSTPARIGLARVFLRAKTSLQYSTRSSPR